MHLNKSVLFSICALLALLAACGTPEASDATAGHASVGPEAEAAKIDRGRYLVGIMGCNDCHSPKLMGAQGPYLDPDRILSGYPADRPLPPLPANLDGWALMNMDLTAAVGPWGTSFAANITSDDTGIGTWTEEQFTRAMKHGLYKGLEGSRPLLPPMPWQNYEHITPEDLGAVFAYLKSTRPVVNVVPAPIAPGPAS